MSRHAGITLLLTVVSLVAWSGCADPAADKPAAEVGAASPAAEPEDAGQAWQFAEGSTVGFVGSGRLFLSFASSASVSWRGKVRSARLSFLSLHSARRCLPAGLNRNWPQPLSARPLRSTRAASPLPVSRLKNRGPPVVARTRSSAGWKQTSRG